MKLVALKFGAEWCGPCKTLEPNLKKMQEEFPSIEFVPIDCDEDTISVKQFNVKTVPTVILLKDNIEINRIIGSVLITPLRKAFRDFAKIKEDKNDNNGT